MPVISATRADRASANATCPDTPALRRTTDTARATPAARATPIDAASRTASGVITSIPT